MRVSKRICLGYGILLASTLLLAAVQILAVRNLQALNEDMSRSGLDTAMTSLQLMQDAELLGQQVHVFFRQGNTEARKQIDVVRESFQSDLLKLRTDARSDAESRELERMFQFWKQFLENLLREQATAKRGEIPAVMVEDLDRIRTQARTIYQAGLDSIKARAEESRTIARQTERLSWVLAAGVIVAGGLISLLIVRSVSIPLSSLAEGTRAMAEGGSCFRLDTSRDDEIAQIAKSFNTIAERLKPPSHTK